MTNEQFITYQEQTFDAFCKAVIRNESIDTHRELAHRATHEVQLSALNFNDLAALRTEDTYCTYRKDFYVLGHKVTITDRTLGEALQFVLPPQRDVILLTYFLECSDLDIAHLLGISNHAVRIRRASGLRRLHTLLEGIADE